MQDGIVSETKEAEAHSKKTILKATGIALITALAILFTVILPAEYGIDLLGAGKLLGLATLAEGKNAKAVIYTPEAGMYESDSAEIKLPPHQGIEYKYRIKEGSGMLYSWAADGDLHYEFHGEPKGAPKGTFQSYEKQIGKESHGTFIAPFEGTHGWYWENRTGELVTIRLVTAGYYEVVGDPKNPKIR